MLLQLARSTDDLPAFLEQELAPSAGEGRLAGRWASFSMRLLNRAGLKDDRRINLALDFPDDFCLSRAHGRPRYPREWIRFEK